MPAIIKKKLVIVGDGAVGKTSLLMAFASNTFSEEYVPTDMYSPYGMRCVSYGCEKGENQKIFCITVFENTVTEISVDKRDVQLTLWDTAGQEDYDRLRPLSYPDSHVVMMCYNTIEPVSLENIREKWHPEVLHYCPNVPVILIGTKADLKETSESIVPLSDGEAVVKELKLACVLECSAKTGREGVEAVFQAAARLAMGLKAQPSRSSNGGGCEVM